MIYSKLSRFYFVFSFVFICFGCCSKITNARMHGKVATIEDIGKMLDEFKAYYKDSYFSNDEKIRNKFWSTKHEDGLSAYHNRDFGFLHKHGGFGNKVFEHLSKFVVEGENFNCFNVTSWCLRWLESRNFVCGLFMNNTVVDKNLLISGFHWNVILPVLDSSGNLDMYVIELYRFNPEGYTREKILMHWHFELHKARWKNFVVIKNDEFCDKKSSDDFKSKYSTVSAPIWVWNIMKHLSKMETSKLGLSARNWLQKYSARVISDLSKNKIDLSIWPYIMPYDKAKQFNRETVGKVSGGILQIPSIVSATFDPECLPDTRQQSNVEIFYPEDIDGDNIDDQNRYWAITKFYLFLRDSRFALKDLIESSSRGKIKSCRLPNSLKSNNCAYFKRILREKRSKEIVQSTLFESMYGQEEIYDSDPEINLGEEKTSPEKFFSGDEVYFELLAPEPNEIFNFNRKNPKKIMCKSESARKYDVKFIDDCYSIKSDPERGNKGK